MIIKDRVYGKVEIKEPVLVKLIKSKPIQRLKGVNQGGAAQFTVKYKDISRFEHTVGVMILLQKLGANVEEQIAGLLHDAPHTAFSHMVDFVFESEDHDYHEKFHEKIIMDSEIPDVLKEFGFDVDRILDETNFPLLENKLPDICADRIDYTLREIVAEFGKENKIDEYVSHFIVKDNEIIFDDADVAKRFAIDFMRTVRENFEHPLQTASDHFLAEAIKLAFKKKILHKDDLFFDDKYVMNVLKKANDPEINDLLKYLTYNLKVELNENDYDFFRKEKLRFIDPKCLIDGNVKRVTKVYPELKDKIEDHKKHLKKGFYIKVVC